MANLSYTKFPIALFFRQHAASIYGFVCFVRLSKKICVSVRWVILWVCPPPCENTCVRSLGHIVGASSPLCVHSIGNTVGVSPPLCVSFHWMTIFVGSFHAAYSALRHFYLLIY